MRIIRLIKAGLNQSDPFVTKHKVFYHDISAAKWKLYAREKFDAIHLKKKMIRVLGGDPGENITEMLFV